MFGCLYALNSIGVCDTLESTIAGGGVSTWRVGRTLELTSFDSMGDIFARVRLESITAVPLPAPLLLMVSGLIGLIGLSRCKAHV